MKSMFKYVGFVVLACALSGTVLASCSSESPSSSNQQEVGNVSLALVGQTGSNVYRLRNARFDINGPTSTQLDSEVAPDATSIQATLAVGNYTVTLLEGWVLQRLDAGVYVTVDAELVSPNPDDFEILANGITRLTYRFATNGQIVDIGTGDVVIDFVVDELNRPCASDADCAAGTTCQNNQCLTAGTCVAECGRPNANNECAALATSIQDNCSEGFTASDSGCELQLDANGVPTCSATCTCLNVGTCVTKCSPPDAQNQCSLAPLIEDNCAPGFVPKAQACFVGTGPDGTVTCESGGCFCVGF